MESPPSVPKHIDRILSWEVCSWFLRHAAQSGLNPCAKPRRRTKVRSASTNAVSRGSLSRGSQVRSFAGGFAQLPRAARPGSCAASRSASTVTAIAILGTATISRACRRGMRTSSNSVTNIRMFCPAAGNFDDHRVRFLHTPVNSTKGRRGRRFWPLQQREAKRLRTPVRFICRLRLIIRLLSVRFADLLSLAHRSQPFDVGNTQMLPLSFSRSPGFSSPSI